jgi:hypothetical protein
MIDGFMPAFSQPERDLEEKKQFFKRATWEHKRYWKWRTCYASGNRIAINEKAYLGTRRISGPGSDVVITHWVREEEFVFMKIRGEIG